MSAPPFTELIFREGATADLRPTFDLAQRAVAETARRMGVQQGGPPTEEQLEQEWARQRDLIQFIVTGQGGSFWVCEDEGASSGTGGSAGLARWRSSRS